MTGSQWTEIKNEFAKAHKKKKKMLAGTTSLVIEILKKRKKKEKGSILLVFSFYKTICVYRRQVTQKRREK